MNKFVIVGPSKPEDETDNLFWHEERGWVDREEATFYGKEILEMYPPPEGCTGIIEESPEGFPVNFYGVPPFPEGSIRE